MTTTTVQKKWRRKIKVTITKEDAVLTAVS
jgi:hypothetical protein